MASPTRPQHQPSRGAAPALLALLCAALLAGGTTAAGPPSPPTDRGPVHAAGGWLPQATDDDRPDPTQPAVLPSHHVVEPGETAGEISARYGIGTDALLEANARSAEAVLRPGDVLVLPDPERTRPVHPARARAEAAGTAEVLRRAAERFGLDPATVKAVAWQESRWDHEQVSERGAIGIMQVLPATGEAISERLGDDLDLYDPDDNIVAGVAYLAELEERYDGDVRRALAAYNQGPERLRAAGLLPQTAVYVEEVLRLRGVFGAAGEVRP